MKIFELFETKAIRLGPTTIYENPNTELIVNKSLSSGGIRGLFVGNTNFIVQSYDMTHEDLAQNVGFNYYDSDVHTYMISKDLGTRDLIAIQLIGDIEFKDLPKDVQKALSIIENKGWKLDFEHYDFHY